MTRSLNTNKRTKDKDNVLTLCEISCHWIRCLYASKADILVCEDTDEEGLKGDEPHDMQVG